jgi:chromosome partitioning protein
MQVIVLATQKGGAGKTTLCGHLAVQAELVGAGPVVLIDADPQASLAVWWNKRQATTPALAQMVGTRGLRTILAQLEDEGAQTVFIDTPGRADESIGQILSSADLVVVPIVPSPHDLQAIGPTIEMVERAGVRLVFVLNNSSGSRLARQAAINLSQHGTLANAECKSRVDYRSSMIDGRTVMELDPRGKSAAEIAELWSYIASKIEQRKKPHGRKASR